MNCSAQTSTPALRRFVPPAVAFGAGPVARNRACITRPVEALEQMTEDLVRFVQQSPGCTVLENDLLGLGWTREQVKNHGTRAQARAQRALQDDETQGALPAPEASRGVPAAPAAPAGTSMSHDLPLREILARNDEAMLRIESLQDDLRREVSAMRGRNAIMRSFISQIEAAHR